MKRVRYICDTPRWAFANNTRGLCRHLPSLGWEGVLAHNENAQQTEADLDGYDAIVFWCWPLAAPNDAAVQAALRFADHVYIGITSFGMIKSPIHKRAWPLLERCAGIYALSRELQHLGREAYHRPIFYCPDGVDTSKFVPAAAPPFPALPMCVAWAGNPAAIGSPKRFESCVSVVRRAGCELRHAARNLTHDQMPDFYRQAHVYLCTSESEGTPLPCLEASACGLPIVTRRVGAMPEFLTDGDGGYFADSDDEGVAALETLMENVDRRSRMGFRAREAALAWDWREQVKNYVAMFEGRATAE